MMRAFWACMVMAVLAACDGGASGGDASGGDSGRVAGGGALREGADEVPGGVSGGPVHGSLDWALNGGWRSLDEFARDGWLKPKLVIETLALSPDTAVVELWPGSGYLTAILGPWLGHGGGMYIVAEPVPRSPGDGLARLRDGLGARIGDVPELSQVGRLDAELLVAAGDVVQVDVALSLDDVHAWMALGVAEEMFAGAFAVLKPGGVFVVIEARGDDVGAQDPAAISGYVQPRYVKVLAQEAGFEFVAGLDVLDNPADDGEHAFGVWSLAPHARTSPLGQAPDPAFDRSALDRVGEPRRMMLIFSKPAVVVVGAADGAE